MTADFAGNSEWGDNDPSVFVIKISGELQGEFHVLVKTCAVGVISLYSSFANDQISMCYIFVMCLNFIIHP